MKLGNLLLIASFLIGATTFAQDDPVEKECTRLRKIANDAMSYTNYKEAVEYFQRAEKICPEFGKDNYDRLSACALSMVTGTEGEEQKPYIDTLLGSWERAEEKEFYDTTDDMNRGYFYLQATEPNYAKADFYLKRGIEAEGKEMNEQFIPLYYFNIYTLWYIETEDEAKANYKQRLITEYFSLSKLINDANFSPSTQEALTSYMRQVITSCDDILPMMPKFMETLPEEVESKKTLMLDMAKLLSELECADSDEFKSLAKALYELDPANKEIQLIRIGTLNCSERIALYKEIKANSTDDVEKNKIQYEIARCYMQMGSYKAAFSAAQAVSGKQKGDALAIMGQAVGKTAMGCGDSTFERKCNYLYAVQLLEQAQANGATGLAGVISSFKSNYPSTDDCFDNGNPASVSLSCWGVSVSPCK